MAQRSLTVQIVLVDGGDGDSTAAATIAEIESSSPEQAYALRELAALAEYYSEQLFTMRTPGRNLSGIVDGIDQGGSN